MRHLFLASSLLCAASALAADWPNLASPAPEQGGGENDAALIMAVEDYAYVPPIPGAAQNAKDWYAYLTRTRKVPPSNVRLAFDADVTAEDILERAEEAASRAGPGGTLWFVFIGHGAPAKNGRDGLLVGHDVQQKAKSLFARSVPQQQLVELFARGKQARTVLVVDACFSGKSSEGAPLVEGLQPLIPKDQLLASTQLPNIHVLTAGASHEFAGPLPGARRPAFSYLILGALRGWGDRNADGRVTTEEAVTYAREAIATAVDDRRQTPELSAGDPKTVLAGGAKEKGPDLVAMVLDRGGKGAPRRELPPLEATPAPTINKSSVTQAVGTLAVEIPNTPGVTLELVSPSGNLIQGALPYRNPSAELGQWSVTARAAGFVPQRKQVAVIADELTVARLELQRMGSLRVEGKPAGAEVLVKGPERFEDKGGLPWEAQGLSSGTYSVEVRRAGYGIFKKEVAVQPGDPVLVSVELQRQTEAEAAGCPDSSIYVPGGSFVRSTTKPNTGYSLEWIKVTEQIRPVCYQRTELTLAEYERCVARKACTKLVPKPTEDEVWAGRFDGGRKTWASFCNRDVASKGDHPVNCVDRQQAEAYCKDVGGRLPTVYEYQWAARGGPAQTKHPWGDLAPTAEHACWSDGEYYRKGTCPVGSHPKGASPLGLHDLVGNVYEWTATQYAHDRPQDSYTTAGSFVTGDPLNLLPSLPAWDPKLERSPANGFRCVFDPKTP